MALAWRRKGMSILAMLTGLILALAMVLGMAGEAYAASLRESAYPVYTRHFTAFGSNRAGYLE